VSWLLRPDRLWTFGALAAAIVLVVLTWMFLIGPQREKTVGMQEQAVSAEVQAVAEQRKLAQLAKDYEQRDRYAAELAANRKALPGEAATADLLRELQTAGDQAGISVTSLTAGSPSELKSTGARVAAVTITISATGRLDRLRTFLDQIQRIQPRAMLLFNVTFAPADADAPISASAQMTVSAQVFVSIPTASTSPSPSASAAN
jgi:Tfp pilus assembly protein PilO